MTASEHSALNDGIRRYGETVIRIGQVRTLKARRAKLVNYALSLSGIEPGGRFYDRARAAADAEMDVYRHFLESWGEIANRLDAATSAAKKVVL